MRVLNKRKFVRLEPNQAYVGTSVSGCVPDILSGDVSTLNVVGFVGNTRMESLKDIKAVSQSYAHMYDGPLCEDRFVRKPITGEVVDMANPILWEEVIIELAIRGTLFQHRVVADATDFTGSIGHIMYDKLASLRSRCSWIVVDRDKYMEHRYDGLFINQLDIEAFTVIPSRRKDATDRRYIKIFGGRA